MKNKKIIVIGSGLGGLSAAISLKQSGYDVEIFEENAQIGGKLNVLKQQGYTFDPGPSILTLPHIFERLFERSGKKMSDYFAIRALRPHWRNFFEDGKVVDLYPEPEKMAAEARKVGEPPENIARFLKYSADLYDLTNEGYFEQGCAIDLPQQRMHGRKPLICCTFAAKEIHTVFQPYVGLTVPDAHPFSMTACNMLPLWTCSRVIPAKGTLIRCTQPPAS